MRQRKPRKRETDFRKSGEDEAEEDDRGSGPGSVHPGYKADNLTTQQKGRRQG